MSARLRFPLLLSIAVALVTIALKSGAYLLTGSVGLLSDALESLINLVAALAALGSLWYSTRPVDASHTYGHEKIEYFSSGLEGGLIVVAAGGIAWVAVRRLVHPVALEPLGVGMALSLVAALLNAGVGVILVRVGKKHGSIILEADGKHLLSDVWSTAGVLAGLCLVALTGWEVIDPLLGLGVAGLVLWTAVDLIQRSFNGLMDRALPPEEVDLLRETIRSYLGPDMHFHALRTRRAGVRRFADFHLLVPGDRTVREAHAVSDRIEEAIQAVLPGIQVTVHIEPIEERASWHDSALLAVEQEEAGGNAPPR
jgi:cation diffusion facilitator family transporter